ncbi:MAG: Anhydro-N-acetylmuramic acid kinase [Candidatus Marinimicrobia bacterium]|nr:Anhydro-N-acetylmuramic acid kinase [Candidatus Neomarinimicrobiota bacterium]
MKRALPRLQQRPVRILGLMSGTSLDGLDIVSVVWDNDKMESFQVEAFDTFEYSDVLQNKILEAINGDAEKICDINFILGNKWVNMVVEFLENHKLQADSVNCIGSHGQTVWHVSGQSTLQLGEPAVLASKTGIPVVSNFREHDIAVGGTGAPLIPFLDWLLYRDLPGHTIALNIGGIANVTCITEGIEQGAVTGWDTGPGNMVVNTLMRQFTDGQKLYDRDGVWAQKGKVNKDLLEDLLQEEFIVQPPPKSTGRELYSDAYIKQLFWDDGEPSQEEKCDLIATASEWTVASIAQNIEQFWQSPDHINHVIVGGGGAHNPYIMERLGSYFPSAEIGSSNEYSLSENAKESVGFAVFARAYLKGVPGNMPGVTGAERSLVLGKLTL